ncbi:MAG: phosphoenolpyruvate carboxylase, partial [Candidatus Magasanikbacteria bacterium]
MTEHRRIPATMVSQHPDHAGKPYWHTEEFISTQHEALECFLSYSELGVSEYKWDWEGKFVDESVLEKLLGDHFEYFKNHPLGKDKFLTFRLPNPNAETEFRLGRAFMGILNAAGLAKQVELHSPPIFEVILPMTESAEEMLEIEEAFDELTQLKHRLYKLGTSAFHHLEVIPLFEQVGTIINSDGILRKYLDLHKAKFNKLPPYVRPYMARSDPALNSGTVPTVLAIKIALSRYAKLEKELGIKMYPIIGSASLPFRGGLRPDAPELFINEYKGVRTALLQSAFRYDYPKEMVIEAIKKLETELPKGEPMKVSDEEEKQLEKFCGIFENYYREAVEGIAGLVNDVAKLLPKRRERVQHIGLFGYSRGVGKVRLPRAIGFTGALYSIGVPPELIGTGRGLREIGLAQKENLKLVEKYYINIKADLKRAG